MIYFFYTLGLGCFLFSILPFIKLKKWWIRVFDFPRFQILVLSSIAIVGIVLSNLKFSSELFAIILPAVASTIQLKYIFPYLPIHFTVVKKISRKAAKKKVSLLISNVMMDNRDYNRLLGCINKYDPDILLTVETDKKWENALKSIESKYLNCVKMPLDNTYGMLLYSKLPLIDPEILYRVKDDVPSIFTKVQFDNKNFLLHCVHPEPPVPGESDSSVPRDRELIMVAQEAKKTEEPCVVIGDLNDVAWSDTTIRFQKISGLKDPRIGRGFFNTFNAKWPFFRWPLDHIFISQHFKLISIKKLSHVGSDHFPIFAEICF